MHLLQVIIVDVPQPDDLYPGQAFNLCSGLNKFISCQTLAIAR